jgi:molybdate transport system permease protein
LDWAALLLSTKLALLTTLVLFPIAVLLARFLGTRSGGVYGFIEALIALPLVLPPTVLGFYFLAWFSPNNAFGRWYGEVFGQSLAFSFEGILLASLVVNLPFATQPMLRGFERIPPSVRESAYCCGFGFWRTLLRIEIPLNRGGILSGLLLSFVHTIGEFGVILMVGGNIAGETRTVSIAIFDRVESFDERGALQMSLTLSLFALLVVGALFALGNQGRTRQGR